MERQIYLAGGCFWGAQRFFDCLPGVTATEVGYANGRTAAPSYEQVKHENTGHAETVRVTYDDAAIGLDELLEQYFRIIDPFSVNRQGGDVGTQYRTGIYWADPADEPAVRAALAAEQARHTRRLAVECGPLQNFYPAEEYHQKYLDKNPGGYCHVPLRMFAEAKAYVPRGGRPADGPAVFWIGDSTVQTNGPETWPQRGMGQMLARYLRPGIAVHNHAKNGRSTKSFWNEGLFEPVEAALAEGDILLIQFGHNDEKPDEARRATPEEYQQNLLRYAQLGQAKGALPVLITPLTRRRFDADGRLTESHGPYPQAVRELAAREGLPLIDLTAASRELVQALGDETSRELYMNFPAGAYPNWPEGSDDNTHLREAGAVRFAGLVANGLRALGAPYAGLLR